MYLWRKNKLAMIGTVIILGFIIVAIFAPVLAPYDPYQQNLHNRLAPPSREHLLGTDQFGRDVLSRIIWGTRIELKIIFLVTVISTTIGTIIGLISGYFGGAVDEILMRITDMFLAFPSLVLAMAFAAALGPSLTNAIIA
ncbi:MAG: D,D-dipeptide ABC transporter permease, partial [Thermotogae bacterium]